MAKYSIPLTISVIALVLMGYACCKPQDKQDGLQPNWEINIPTGSSDDIFYDGLQNLHFYNDWIIAHTTVADDGIFREDNRLCAINVKTEKVDWYFPANIEEKGYAHFGGKGYLYRNKLFFRYIKDYKETSESNLTTVCLDLNSQKVVWENTEDRDLSQRGRGLGNGVSVVGVDNRCFFVQNEKELYCYNLNNDSCEKIFAYDGDEQFIGSLLLDENKDLLILFCYDFQKDEEDYSFKNNIHILRLNSFNEIYVKGISPPKGSYSNHFGATGVEKNGVIYVGIDRYLAALDWQNDKLLWEREDEVEVESYVKQDLYVRNQTLITCCVNATLGYDISTGSIKYYYNNHGSHHATFDGPYAYMARMNGKMEIIEVETGKILDTVVSPGYNNTNGGFFGSYPTLHGDKLYIMGDRNSLFCYPKYPW